MTSTKKILLETVMGEIQERPPIWIMRQAGRYLPEYREIREQAEGFLDLCYTPRYATEVTLQPLRRFDLDAAIIFSDILVVPDALGQKVRFETGEGPVLDPLTRSHLSQLQVNKVVPQLQPVLDTIANVRSALAPEKTLIGFCGSPWTLATYMIGGKGSPDQAAARLFALNEPDAFRALIDILVEASIDYLAAQFAAGVDVVQLFESWALNLDEIAFENYVVEPNRRIVRELRKRVPNAPVIGFPRGAAGMLARYASQTGVNMLGLDFATPIGFANTALPKKLGVQGNLDPLRLVVGGVQMEVRAREIISGFANRPHVFNLGHGITQWTPPEERCSPPWLLPPARHSLCPAPPRRNTI